MGKKKMSPRMRRAAEANEAVERITMCTQRLSADLADIPQAGENVRRLRRGESARWPQGLVDQYGAESILALNDNVSRNAVVDLWRQQGRVAYDIHPELATQLYRSDLKGKMPGNLFERLPHINPVIPLPRPWPFRSTRNGLIRAYFITGLKGQEAFCRTTDPGRTGLGVMPWIEWEGAAPDDYLEVTTPLFALPNTNGPFTLDDVLNQTSAWHNTVAQGGEMKLIRQILPGLMSLMMYLCCDNRDMPSEQQEASTGKRRQAAPPRDPYWVRVGWHIGPKLHSQRMLAQGGGRDRGGVSVPSGAEYGPQHRVGHYKVVHHGPKKSLQSLRWIQPYWTKKEELERMLEEGQEPGTQVVPVDHQRRDPSGHRDVKLANLGTEKAKEVREREAQRRREENMEW